jgi:hypothetical protein
MKLASFSSPSGIVALAIVSLGAVGCAGTPGDANGTAADEAATESALSSAPRIGSIVANGTGCGVGTTSVDLLPDGKTAVVHFDELKGELVDGAAMDIKDCTLLVDVANGSGYSYALDTFAFDGDAAIDGDGVTATQTIKTYVMGNALRSADQEANIENSGDEGYSFSGKIRTSATVWSPCSAQRSLVVGSRLVLENNEDHTGSATVGASTLTLKLKLRRC